jgi:hypothetical protein
MDDEPVPGIAGALDDIRAFAAGMCEEAGDPGALERLRLDRTDTRLVFQVIDAEACGSSISGFLKPGRAHIMVRNALNRILRQRSRERAIVEAGETPGADPAWSIDIHPVTLSVLIHGGVNPALTALLERLAGPDDALKRAAQGGPLRIGDAKLVSGRVSIATISGNGHPTDDVVNVHENTQYLQTVMIRQGLPDTVVAGLPGRLGGMRDRLVQALDGDTAEVAAAFDAAFGRCEATPGDAAVGYAHAGSYAIEVRRDIGE